MADDDKQPKLSQQLVMTPQLQMAIRLLATPSRELPVADWRATFAGLRDLAPGEPDPLDEAEEHAAIDEERQPWYALAESPLPVVGELPDVWIFGNPPQARANRHAYPSLAASDKDAMWVVRSLRQRARTYEKVVAAFLALRPQLAISIEPSEVAAVETRAVSEAAGLHESTVERVASAVRIQNLHGLVGVEKRGKKLAFVRG